MMDITAHTYDKTVIFTACSDAPHKRSSVKLRSKEPDVELNFPRGIVKLDDRNDGIRIQGEAR